MRSTIDKQRFLVSIGLDVGGVGTGWGAKSIAAVTQLQKWVGLTADGQWGQGTEGVVKIIEAGGNWSSRSVREIQAFLRGKSYPVGAIDSQWGNKTSLSVYMYQRSVKLKADAQWGTATDGKAFPPKPEPKPEPEPKPVPGRNATMRPLEQIQAFLKVKTTGIWDQATADATLAYQKAQGIEQDYVWGQTSDGLAFPPEGSIHGVDYSFARPNIPILVSRGVKLVGRYLWNEKYADGRTNKGISRGELDTLWAAGMEVFFIYEEDGKELLGGFDAGVRVATAAEAHRKAIGVGKVPIYFNVDYDAPPADFDAIKDALRGVASVIGVERTGLYAGFYPVKMALDAGLATWGFQTYAWSKGQWDSRAQLQQWSNGQWGGTVDFTRAMMSEFGQTPIDPPVEPPVAPDVVAVPRAELEATVATLTGWLA